MDCMTRLNPLARLASVFTTPHAPEDFLRLVNPLSSARQLRGIVTRVDRETPDSATIHFRPGRGWHAHEAGQWARIGVDIDGVRQWRSYSLTTAGGEDPAITVTAIGAISEALVHRTEPGDVLFLSPPQGDFVLPEHPRPLLMLTAGSGLTPVMSMVRTLVRRRSDADVELVHSARTRETALFRDELEELAGLDHGLTVHHWITGERGRRFDLTSTDDLDATVPDWRERATYVCGPTEMIDDAEALWRAAEVESRLVIERFAPITLPGSGGDGGRVVFEKSDKEVDADGATTLLDAGEDAGVIMPSGCRMGICQSCLVPLQAGRVRDLRTGEVHGDEGQLIQTCVSTAAGDVYLDV
ncbi:ferredoxin reductase [Lapillicoccus jejuensis]|uniref:Ferredoxin-NADP reductase n=2 Tax=Lapillicoccus jejuensis TaxID=402171 RepID=A0A542E1J1_9MICO|nr:ferredoxin-NADP reductase [Lapillicoccus jejuensis]